MAIFTKARSRARVAAVAGLMASVSLGSAAFAQDDIDGSVVDLDSAGGMDELVAQARQEGDLLVYGAPAADKMQNWFSGFTEEYGIPVQYYRGPTNQIYQRYSQEQNAGLKMADTLIVSVLEVVQDAIDNEYLAEYTPQTADLFPQDATLPGYAYPAYVTLQSVAWNTDLVPDDLQEQFRTDPLNALLDPRLKDHLAVVSVTAGGAQIASAANIALNMEDDYGWGYLEKLAAQNPDLIDTSPAMLPAVIAGDYWATPDGYESIFAPAAMDGAPVAYSFPPVASATQFFLGVSANAAHPHAARLLQEWMTSEASQARLAELSQATMTIEGWKDTRAIRDKPWFNPPKKLWFGAATDPRLTGDNRDAFFERWNDLFRY